MNLQQLNKLYLEGFPVESHRHTHNPFTQQSTDKIKLELYQSRKLLKEHLNTDSVDLCLPYGEYLPEHEDIFLAEGIRSIAMTSTDHGTGNPDLIKLRRFEVKSNTSQSEIISYLTGKK